MAKKPTAKEDLVTDVAEIAEAMKDTSGRTTEQLDNGLHVEKEPTAEDTPTAFEEFYRRGAP